MPLIKVPELKNMTTKRVIINQRKLKNIKSNQTFKKSKAKKHLLLKTKLIYILN